MKIQKTNAMRMLDSAKIAYEVFEYPHHNEAIDGVEVAKLLKQNPEQVFKTLVTSANTKEYFVFVIPVTHELDLKKCAAAVHVKSIAMVAVKDITKLTGYVRGGCSPIGMKKAYSALIHESCQYFDAIMFSGGKIGCQLKVHPVALCNMIHAQVADVIKEV